MKSATGASRFLLVAEVRRAAHIPIMTRSLPLLPLRDIVVFPQRIVPLFVGREKSVAALEAAMGADKELFLVAQLDPAEDDPGRDDLYDLGVVATAMQLWKLPDGTVRVLGPRRRPRGRAARRHRLLRPGVRRGAGRR